MTITTTNSHQINTVKVSNIPSIIGSNRLVIGVLSFSISFGLSIVPRWDFSHALISAIITVIATYAAALFADKRRRNHELMVLNSLYPKIRQMEQLKYRIVREIEQLEQHKVLAYTESKQLENQILDCRNKRDTIHREIGNYAAEKRQLELEIGTMEETMGELQNSRQELHKSCIDLTAEKRRLDINCQVLRSEIGQLQSQIAIYKQEKEELESNLVLSQRLKPQLEEKLHELRTESQDLEDKVLTQKNLLQEAIETEQGLQAKMVDLQHHKQKHETEVSQLQNRISLLRDEHDLLQNQVWELLQNLETLAPQTTLADDEDNNEENNVELFPFDDLL
ncbi:hypothetical protein [Cylindrospermopsis raciborskii]|uniref:hypothetical protein n=1 Tax=Cylindrospermopsis raciborskii TaxID=77022 RepID=UPI0038D0AFE4